MHASICLVQHPEIADWLADDDDELVYAGSYVMSS
jgi:hypothetical protein